MITLITGYKLTASILHGNAKTTPRVRKEIQNANKSIFELAKIYHPTPKTISK